MCEDEKRGLIDDIIRMGETRSPEISRGLPEAWLSVELTTPQLKALLWLHSRGPSRVSDVADALGASHAVTSGVLDRLVHHSLVVRSGDPGDRRVVLCSLSDEGETLAHRLWQSSVAWGREVLEVMTVEELRLVRAAVDVVFGALRRVDDETRRGTQEEDTDVPGGSR